MFFKEDQVKCIDGLIDVVMVVCVVIDKFKNFDEWIFWMCGEGVVDVFMRFYNYKVWVVFIIKV